MPLKELLQQKVSALGLSVLLHGLLLAAVLWAGMTTVEKKPVAAPKTPVIQAHAVDGKQLKAREERKRREKEAVARKKREAEKKQKIKKKKK